MLAVLHELGCCIFIDLLGFCVSSQFAVTVITSMKLATSSQFLKMASTFSASVNWVMMDRKYQTVNLSSLVNITLFNTFLFDW